MEVMSSDLGDLVMAACDIQSLLTNIPLEEIITISIDNLFKDSELSEGFNHIQMTVLLRLSVSDSLLIFSNETQKQID